MLTAPALTITPDAAEELARRVVAAGEPVLSRTPWLRALDCVELVSKVANNTDTATLCRAAALVAERFERQ